MLKKTSYSVVIIWRELDSSSPSLENSTYPPHSVSVLCLLNTIVYLFVSDIILCSQVHITVEFMLHMNYRPYVNNCAQVFFSVYGKGKLYISSLRCKGLLHKVSSLKVRGDCIKLVHLR